MPSFESSRDTVLFCSLQDRMYGMSRPGTCLVWYEDTMFLYSTTHWQKFTRGGDAWQCTILWKTWLMLESPAPLYTAFFTKDFQRDWCKMQGRMIRQLFKEEAAQIRTYKGRGWEGRTSSCALLGTLSAFLMRWMYSWDWVDWFWPIMPMPPSWLKVLTGSIEGIVGTTPWESCLLLKSPRVLPLMPWCGGLGGGGICSRAFSPLPSEFVSSDSMFAL